MTIESILRERGQDVPQPEGAEVADAYTSGLLSNEERMMYVIAYLLHEVREAQSQLDTFVEVTS